MAVSIAQDREEGGWDGVAEALGKLSDSGHKDDRTGWGIGCGC